MLNGCKFNQCKLNSDVVNVKSPTPVTTQPGGSHGFYPIDYYYKFLQGGKNVRYLIKVCGEKSYDEKADIKVDSLKRIKDRLRLRIKGTKELDLKNRLQIYGNKSIYKEATASIDGKKSSESILRTYAEGQKELNLCENIYVKGKKDVTNILVALDIL